MYIFIRLWSHRVQFIKYFFVGGTTFAIDLGIFLLLSKIFHVWYIAASVVSQILAVVYNFLLHRFWSFRAHEGVAHKQLARYIAVLAFNYFFSLGMLWIFVEQFSLDAAFAKVGAVAVIGLYNFFVLKYVVYRA